MGTRGAIGFYDQGKTVVAYNHYDSYPDHLGFEVAKACRDIMGEIGLMKSIENARAIQLIDENVPPTAEQIARCQELGIVDLGVSRQSTSDWYCLLRGAQGDATAMFNGRLPYIHNSEDFLKDSLFCEYAYIVNFDNGTLEFYTGFNRDRKAPGRYANVKGEYSGVRLSAEFKLEEFSHKSDEELAKLVKEMNAADKLARSA